MAKRFTDSEKFRDYWYRALKPKHKCLWEFMLSECSIAGILELDFDSISFHIGEKITKDDLKNFKDRVVFLEENKIFIAKFIKFQQNELNSNNPAHKNIIKILKTYGIDESLNLPNIQRSFKGACEELQSSISNSNSNSNSNSLGNNLNNKEEFNNTIHTRDDEPSKNETQKEKRFIKPTFEEITAYCKERNNSVDPQRFMDFYASNGWKVGKNPMKDWKASVRNWEKNNNQSSYLKQKGNYDSFGGSYGNDIPL